MLLPKRGSATVSALLQAAIMNAAAAAKVLLVAGADRTAKNHAGKPPYELAKDLGNSVEPILRRRR
jgi:ankyrin repeat protein